MAPTGWAEDVTPVNGSVTDGLVHSRKAPVLAATGLCVLSVLLIPFDQFWAGYGAGVVASVVCMLAILDDREKQTKPGFVGAGMLGGKGPSVQQFARLFRVASFLVCLVHIVRLAQEAAK